MVPLCRGSVLCRPPPRRSPAPSSVRRLFPLSISPFWGRGRALTDGLLAGQRRLQGRAGGGQVWTGAGLKHGGDVEGLEGGGRHEQRKKWCQDHTRRQSSRCLLTQRGIRRGRRGRGRGLLSKQTADQRETNPAKPPDNSFYKGCLDDS